MARLDRVEAGFYRIPLPEVLTDSTHGAMRAFEIVTARVRDADGAEGEAGRALPLRTPLPGPSGLGLAVGPPLLSTHRATGYGQGCHNPDSSPADISVR